jgi:hypothetical protein
MQVIPLIDSRIVAQTFAMRRQVQHPRLRSSEPVLPGAQAYGSVLRDRSGLWRMWYLGAPVYCEYYAVSEDGWHWRRPELDLVAASVRAQLDGPNAFLCRNQRDAHGNWLVGTQGPEGFCVLDAEQTPHPAAKARYTALYLARTEAEAGMWVAHSDDGIHWIADPASPVIRGWRDTSSALLYDERRSKYVWYGRPAAYAATAMHANRLIACQQSDDLVHWTPDRTILDTDDADADPFSLLDEAVLRAGWDRASAEGRAAAWAALTEGQCADSGRPLVRGRNRQFYGITPFPYAGLYLGIAWMYDLPSGDMWTELVHSYDGLQWRREPVRVPFVPRLPGTCTCTVASPPIAVGDEVWIYDSINNRTHHGVPNPAVAKGIRIVALPRDRWVGYVAGEIQGELLTQVMDRPDDLRLNAAAEPAGWLRVEVADAGGRPLDGLTRDECEPLLEDRLDWRPAWQSGKTLSGVADRAIRLRIHARRASVFALTV